MPHENSETVEIDGRFYNVKGGTKERLKPTYDFEKESYDTLEEAVNAAKERSRRQGDDRDAPLGPQAPQVPLDELYAERYAQREEEAYQRITLENRITPEGVPVDVSPEGLARSASAAARLPGVRERLTGEFKEPTLRGAINTVLGTVTGGVLTLDAIDEHLRAAVEGKPSPLAEKLKSAEALRLLDPVGNTAEAIARETAQRQGLPEELQEKTAQAVGLLAAVLVPSGIIRKMGTPAARRLAMEVYMNSLFSGPTTHAGNILANSLTSVWAVPERFLAAGADALRYGVTLGKHERTVFFGESGAMAFGMVHALVDAVRESVRAFKTGKSTIGPSIIDELSPQAARPRFRYGPEGLRQVEAEETTIGQGVGLWGTIWRAPTRALGAEDAFFKTINYSGELHALAYRDAVRRGELSVDAVRNFVRSAPSEAVTRSKEFAITHTFQRELDELGGGVLGRLGAVGESIQDVPMGRLIVPIIRTPTNLAHFATERTPILGMMSRTFRADIAAGGARASLALGKQAGGATLAAAFTYFGASEIVTGGGPVDAALRRAKTELTGWQPYSIRIGDTYYSYNRLEPIGAMLGIIADYSEIRSELPEWQAREIGQAIGLAASRNLADGRFLEGLSDFFDALEGDKPALERLLKSVLRVTTPAGGALRAVTRSVDPVRRETDPGAVEDGEWREARLILNEYKAQVPGSGLPPRRNLWGDPVEVPKGWGPDWLSPVYTSVRKNDPAGEEVVKLSKLGLLTVTRPKRVIFGADPEGHPIDTPASPLDTGIELTDAEYDDFVKLAGNETKIDGLGLHDKITELVTKDTEYREASDALQAVIIRNHISAYRRAALVELLVRHEGIMETYEKRIQTKARALEEERTPGRVTPNIGR